MDLQRVQVNKTSCQMKYLKKQYSTVNSSVITLYSKENSPYNYHESNFNFQQEKSCMSKTIKIFKFRKRRKSYIFKGHSSVFCQTKNPDIMRKYSMPILRDILCFTTSNSKTKSSDEIISRKSNSYKRTAAAEHSYYFRNSIFKPSYKIYRCQFNIPEESCCCSCNSDAMFEVMKSLYDCYKKKNCDHCNCILCGHLPREERRLAELRKSDVGIMKLSKKQMKERKKTEAKKNKELSSQLKGKSAAENEKILEDSGLHLSEERTKSEKELEKKDIARRISEKGNVPLAKAIISMKKIPSAKLRKAKEAGLLTPLEGKTAKQKENILRGLAMNGIPLPRGKTASDKKLIEKVIEELGLPPPPKTSAAELRFQKAIKAGFVTPLEGKSTSEKEKNLKNLAQLGVELPVGRTASEKSLIAKVKASAAVQSEVGDRPEKVKTKVSGLVSLLSKKSPEQKEKILKNLAMRNVPLPEGKTPSEKILINKVRTDVGLPPKAESKSEKEKYKQAEAAGLIIPLKGKTPAEKEKILRAQADFGLPLPEGRTPSEKSLIKKIKKSEKKRIKSRKKGSDSLPLPLDKRKKLDAKTLKVMKEGKGPSDECICGLLIPEKERISIVSKTSLPHKKKVTKAEIAKSSILLNGKTPSQKEKILRNIAKQGFPLPDPKTPLDKTIIDKVRQDLGLPPQPKTLGIKTPLEEKTPSHKEKILTKMHEAGTLSPKDKVSSEKALTKKVKGEVTKEPYKGKVPSEKLREAKVKGLLTPLDGKTSAQKEKILRGLAKTGIPLPEGKTPSEKALIHKIQAKESRVSPRPSLPTRPSLSPDKLKKIDKKTAKVIKEGKGPSDECICDLLMPESKREKIGMPAHKKLSQTISSEKLRKASATGLFTPLKGKTPEQKEKILKRLAMQKIPLPEPKTASEKKLIEKVRASVGLPPEPKTSFEKAQYKKAITAGLITPLQGKSETQKEKILRGQKEIGLKLPEPRTPSEKALIHKINESVPSLKYVLPEKMRKSKAPEFVALEGKTPEQKENILKGLALKGIPLPEPKTSSEKKLIKKIRADIGLPPIPKTSSIKERYDKAKADGLITPLHGKSAAQKEKILRGQAQMGLPLPEGRTASEKALIAKIKAKPAVDVPKFSKSIENIGRPKVTKLDKKTAKVMKEGKGPSDDCICGILTPESEKAPKGAPSVIVPKQAEILKVPSKKIRKAKAAGLMTPLKGKTPKQKEKILKELAMRGIPLPEAKTGSEKKLLEKVRNEVGLPPEPKTPSMKLKYNKAIADDVIVPLERKTNAEKEKTLRNQAALGIPLAVGRTASEKAIIDKIKESIPSEKIRKAKTTTGLLTPLEVEPISEKGKIKTKSKIVGASGFRRSVGRVGLTKSKGGIVEEFQDITKTTTCDRGCGCDKKKIRFKHSYVKIRVTSPDISSLCPCPEECVPGVKGGVFTDNEGIKVTVGRVMCFSSYSLRRLYQNQNSSSLTYVPFKNTNENKLNNISKSETEIFLQERFKQNRKVSNGFITNKLNRELNKTDTSNLLFKSDESSSSLHYEHSSIKSSSFDSVYFLKENSSLSLITIPSIASVWSFSTTSISTNSSLNKQSFIKYDTNNYENSLVLEDTDSQISNITLDLYKYSSDIKQYLLEFPINGGNNLLVDNDIQIYRVSDVNKEDLLLDAQNHDNYVGYVEKLSDKDKILNAKNSRILSKTQLKKSSSIIIIVASSSDSFTTSNNSSVICLEISEDRPNLNPGTSGLHRILQKQKSFKITKRKNFHVIKTDSSHIRVLPKTHKVKRSDTTKLNHEYDGYQPGSGWNKLKTISTDTIDHQPYFGNEMIAKNVESNKMAQIDNIVSEFVKPMILEEVVAQSLYHDLDILDLPLANSIQISHLTMRQSNCCKRTPIHSCNIPSCSGYQSCHASTSPNTKTLAHPNNFRNSNSYKSCDCTPTKLKEIFEKNTIQLISKACGDSKEELRKKHIKLDYELNRTPYVIRTQDSKSNSCYSSKLNLQSCINSDKSKKHLCPCEQHHKISNLNNEVSSYKTEDFNLKNKYKDKAGLKNKKNIICKCPKEEPEPDIEIDEDEWFDETQLRKIQSDLTQTTSGFKIKIKKKQSDFELSFEEALRYIVENLENDKINEEICVCNGKSKKAKHAKCECPYEPYDIQNVEEPPTIKETYKGIKFHIDGKGTASKGLSGILCFE